MRKRGRPLRKDAAPISQSATSVGGAREVGGVAAGESGPPNIVSPKEIAMDEATGSTQAQDGKWFWSQRGATMGPVDLEELRRLAASG